MSVGALVAPVLGPDELGESIGWDAEDGTLLRVDVLGGLVHRVADPLGSRPRSTALRFDGEVGFALPRRGGGLVVGVERAIWLVDSEGERHLLLELDDRPENRWNDASCDARGRLWAGTFARDRRAGAAALYRIDPDGCFETVLDGLTISNGLGWLDAGARLHFVDSPTQRVDVIDVDVDAGRLGARRPLVEIPAPAGMPDGLCVDVEDGTWVALFGGARLLRYDRRGASTEELDLPVPHPTNVCLGGPSGRDLFVSTARHRLSADQRAALPAAGCVLHASGQVAGPPTLAFAG